MHLPFTHYTSHWSNWITRYPETSIVSLHDTYINKTLTELPLYRVKSLLTDITDIFFLQQQNNPERYAHLMHYIILWKSQHPHGFRAVQLETEFLSWVTEYSWYINQLYSSSPVIFSCKRIQSIYLSAVFQFATPFCIIFTSWKIYSQIMYRLYS